MSEPTTPAKSPLAHGEHGALLALVLAITQGDPERFDATMQTIYPQWLAIRRDLSGETEQR